MNAPRATRKLTLPDDFKYRSMLIYARILGARYDVNIVFTPKVPLAATNGKTIFIQPIDIGDEEDAVLFEGEIDHEAGGHLLHTDFTALERDLDKQPLFTKKIFNVIEDVWIERELYKKKPGCRFTILKALDIMIKRKCFGSPSGDAHPAALVQGTLLCGLRSTKLGQSVLHAFFLEHMELLKSTVSPQLAGDIWALAQGVDQVNSSAEAIELAKSITHLLRQAAEPPPPPTKGPSSPPKPQQQSDTEEQDDDSPEGSGSPSDSEQDESPRDSPSDPSQDSQPADDSQDGEPSTPSDAEPGAHAESDHDPQADGASKPKPASARGQPTDNHPQDEFDGTASGKPQADPEADADERSPGSPEVGEPSDADAEPDSPEPPSPAPHDGADPDQDPLTAEPEDPSQLGQGDSPGDSESDPEPEPADLTEEQADNVRRSLQAGDDDMPSGDFGDTIRKAKSSKPGAQPPQGSAYGMGAGNRWDLTKKKAVPMPDFDVRVNVLARPVSVKLGSKLDELLSVQTSVETELRRQGRRVAQRLLPGVITSGRTNIFRRTDEQEALDTAVLLLTDVSGSMQSPLEGGSTSIEAASAATRALGDTLDRFDIPFAIRYFGEALTMVKSFEQRWRSVRSLHWSALESSTSTHQALNTVIPEIATRDEIRRLLVLTTDGAPSDPRKTVIALLEGMRASVDVVVVLVTSNRLEPSIAAFAKMLQQTGIPYRFAAKQEDLTSAIFESVRDAVRLAPA
jgi:hypothetical protein